MLLVYNENDNVDLVESFIDSDGDEYFLVFENNVQAFSFKTTVKNAKNTFKQFLSKHPFLSGIAMSVGMDAIDSYKQSKRLTTRFFAKTPVERELYKKISNDLVKTGKYKLVKTKRIHGGVLYELKRDKA